MCRLGVGQDFVRTHVDLGGRGLERTQPWRGVEATQVVSQRLRPGTHMCTTTRRSLESCREQGAGRASTVIGRPSCEVGRQRPVSRTIPEHRTVHSGVNFECKSRDRLEKVGSQEAEYRNQGGLSTKRQRVCPGVNDETGEHPTRTTSLEGRERRTRLGRVRTPE